MSLTWGQISILHKGWGELHNRNNNSKLPSKNLQNDIEYQNNLARKILAATKKDGKVDMGKVFGR